MIDTYLGGLIAHQLFYYNFLRSLMHGPRSLAGFIDQDDFDYWVTKSSSAPVSAIEVTRTMLHSQRATSPLSFGYLPADSYN